MVNRIWGITANRPYLSFTGDFSILFFIENRLKFELFFLYYYFYILSQWRPAHFISHYTIFSPLHLTDVSKSISSLFFLKSFTAFSNIFMYSSFLPSPFFFYHLLFLLFLQSRRLLQILSLLSVQRRIYINTRSYMLGTCSECLYFFPLFSSF